MDKIKIKNSRKDQKKKPNSDFFLKNITHESLARAIKKREEGTLIKNERRI